MIEIIKGSYKNWCFTFFPDNDIKIETFGDYICHRIHPVYIIIGEEYAPNTGKRHFQGYFRLEAKKSFGKLKKFININEIHLEKANGSEKQNINYCTKPNESNFPEKIIYEKGDRFKSENKKFNWDEFLHDIEILDLKEIQIKYPKQCFLRYQNILKYRNMLNIGNKTWKGDLSIKNYWVYGDTGVGKSKWVKSQLIEDVNLEINFNIFSKNQNKWWDGYLSQKIVNIEDWSPGENGSLSKLLINHLKIWADRYSFNAEVKGGSIPVYPGSYFLIITSNFSIDEAFVNSDPKDISAIKRRFSEIYIHNRNDIFLSNNLDPSILN